MFRPVIRSWRLLSRREKNHLTFFASSKVLVNAADLLGLLLVGLVAVLAVGGEIPISFLRDLPIAGDTLLIATLSAAGAIFTAKSVFSALLQRSTLLFLARVESRFSIDLATAMFGGGLTKLRENSPADIEWAVLRSTQIAFTSILGQAVTLLSEFLLAAMVFGLLFLADWRSAVAIILYILLVLSAFQLHSRKLITKSGSDFGRGSVLVAEALKNLMVAHREIVVLSKTEFFLNILATSRATVSEAGAVVGFISLVPRLIVELGIILGALGFVLVQFWFGNGLSDPFLLGVFLVGSMRMMASVLPLNQAWMTLKYQQPLAEAAQKLLFEMKTDADIARLVRHDAQGEEGKLSARGGVELEVENLSFSYPGANDGQAALRGVSLRAEPGTKVAIIGPSGAGKSTLVDLILGLNQPSSGEIKCAGMRPEALRALIPGSFGYVPQKPGMVSGTIEQNIALGVPPEQVDQDRLREAMSDASIADFVESLPQGAKTVLGTHLDSLSGGQLQRLGLARALYSRPLFLVLDEATSALDAETEESISLTLERLRGKVTVIVVAHRLSTVQKADKIYVLDGGRIITSGNFREIRENSELVRKYVALMSIDD